MTRRLAAILAAALLAGAAAAVFLLGRGHDGPRRLTTAAPRPHAVVPSKQQSGFSWPVYGFDLARTHAAPPLGLRPPFRKLWTVHGDWSLIEFPPVLADGRLFLGTNHGLVLAVEAASGHVVWERKFAGCIAASPAVGNGTVYFGFMDPPPCRGTAPSFLAALDVRSGRTLWRFRAGVIETPPLLAGGRVYFGSWDHRVYAVDSRTGRLAWSFATGGRVKGGVALSAGTIFAGSYDGRLYALDARTGLRRLDQRARLRLRDLERAAALVDSDRELRLLAGRALRGECLRRLVRPPPLRALPGDRPHSLDLRRPRADLRSPDCARRARLRLQLWVLLDLRAERPGTADVRRRRPHRPTRLAISGRRVQPGHRRPPTPLPHRLHAPVRARTESSLAAG